MRLRITIFTRKSYITKQEKKVIISLDLSYLGNSSAYVEEYNKRWRIKVSKLIIYIEGAHIKRTYLIHKICVE
ncbi:hypothetical protein Desaci_3833 [Desulfosporosinus acidiphilus SJ4]|uniref:Uncharacterized protein n=1 Tax=Desulfosporosinus acidiphilus (strain DSM 22704 / JCM 16185 / SJ4) TaxID=646529 RepID=I4DA90_DESAJ|nr:hypothetical protein Desaci_3833 [Desulfosporosinus acidiphilus SJ4]